MKEAMSNALILNIVIIFLFIFIILFAGSTSYTKAFKVKNRIISIIERNENTVVKTGINSDVVEEIELALADVGYRIVMNNDQKCKTALTNRFKNTNQNYKVVDTTGTNSYRYCIAEFYDENSVMHGKYYAVVAYMYFEVPLINQGLEFPVYGETKTMGIAY